MNYTLTILDDRYLQGSIVLILSLNGLFLNFVIIHSKLVTNKRAIMSLVLASYVFLLPNFLVYLPCAFADCSYFSPLWLNLLATPDTIGYYTYQLSLTHLSIERVLVFYSESWAKRIQRYMAHITITIWFFVSFLTVVEWFFNCRKRFNSVELYMYFDAQGPGEIFLMLHKIISYACPVVMMICYSAVFIRLRVLHSKMDNIKVWKELSLVFQYLFVCVLSWLGTLCFFFLGNLQAFFQSYIGLVPILASNLSLTSHAYVFLLTNDKLRRHMSRTLHKFFHLKRRGSIGDTVTVMVHPTKIKSSSPIPVQA